MQAQLDEHRNDFVNYKGRIEVQIKEVQEDSDKSLLGKTAMQEAHFERLNK